jgi:hypothetical protein
MALYTRSEVTVDTCMHVLLDRMSMESHSKFSPVHFPSDHVKFIHIRDVGGEA